MSSNNYHIIRAPAMYHNDYSSYSYVPLKIIHPIAMYHNDYSSYSYVP